MIIDFSASPVHEFGPLCGILRSIRKIAASEEAEFMVVGAAARDLIHRGLGFEAPLARTSDVDIAISVPDLPAYTKLVDQLEPLGDSRIRFLINEKPVDVIPFGGIERPLGTAVPHVDGHRVDVFAMQEVFETAGQYRLPGGAVVKVPTPAGYAALKIKAWVDIGHLGWTKHARDLLYVCMWYRDSARLNASLYDTELDADLIQRADFDQDLAAMFLLGRHIHASIGDGRSATLGEMWSAASRRSMAAAERGDPTIASLASRDYDSRLRDFDAVHLVMTEPLRNISA